MDLLDSPVNSQKLENMKNLMIYLGGIITGILIVLLFAEVSSSTESKTNESRDILAENGVVLFEQPGDMILTKPLKILQVLSKGVALAKEYSEEFLSDELVVLLLSKDEYFYDDQKIELSKEKCFKQVGVYSYETNGGFLKTVPVVKEFDK